MPKMPSFILRESQINYMAKQKLPAKVISQVRAYKDILRADKLPFKDVYVFGSYAKGTQRKHSDIDVCIISTRFKDAWTALTYLRRKVPNGLEWSIEPVGFSPKDFEDKYSTLIYEIKKHGIKVK